MKLLTKLDQVLDGQWKDGFDSLALLFMRLIFGLGLLSHGWSKFQRWDEMSASFPDPLGLGSSSFSLGLVIFAELLCSALVVVGFLTRLASIPVLIAMVVVLVIIHGADPFAKKELAMMYMAGFLGIFLLGPGKLSLDALFLKRS